MQLIKSQEELQGFLDDLRSRQATLGFVPTMGALHQGHVSLVQRALQENDACIASIYVNPAQFNDPKDFECYPRQEGSDIHTLAQASCTAVFLPEYSTIYPKGNTASTEVHYEVAQGLEGKHRPGHFSGVVAVVRRFFELIAPDRAYFGLKDYQQYLVIRAMAAELNMGIDIVGCETVRDPDGLAMSSRNQLLREQDRTTALHISATLREVKAAYSKGERKGLAALGRKLLQGCNGLDLEYFEVLDAKSLRPMEHSAEAQKDEVVALVAARVGGIRLIDNMRLC